MQPVSTMTTVKQVVVFVFLFFSCQLASSKRTADLKREILDQILPKNGNEILIAPKNSSNDSTVVEVFAHVLSIDSLNEENMDFTVRLFLRQIWKDDRLKYDNNKGQIKHIVINEPHAIWTPDTVFSYQKRGYSYDITHPNVFLRIYPDGIVLYSRKLSITADCLVNLGKFPFDQQECRLRIAAYGSYAEDFLLYWRDYVPVTISKSVGLPLFDLEKFETSFQIINTIRVLSYLTISFSLSRTFGYYLYHIYIPYTMLVILSWIPFWLSKKLVVARIFISLAVLLTTTLMINGQNKNQAKLAYRTCMDCFTGTCLSFMFISIIETVLVHFLVEKENNSETKNFIANKNLHKEELKGIALIKAWIAKLPFKTNYIDIGARFIVPFIFVIFCIIYFVCAGRLGHKNVVGIDMW